MIEKFIVDRDDTVYEAWPDLAMTEKGEYICVFTECTAHANRANSRIMVKRSADRGVTWAEKQPLTEYTGPHVYYNCARIFRMRSGEICVLCDKAVDGHPELCELWLWKGDKEGRRFKKPEKLPLAGIVPDKLLELKSGRQIVSAHTNIEGKLVQRAIYSDDGGKTWSAPVIVGQDPSYNLCEVSLLETETGEIVAFMRENSGLGIDCLKSVSYDGGESFQGLYRVPIPACHRPVAGYLDKDTVMVTYRFMQGGAGWLGNWTQNVFAAFLPAGCLLETERNKQSCRIFPLDFDRSPVSDLGYTGWVKDEYGIYVVNYIVDDAPKAHIRGYRFTLDDVLIKR